MFQPFGRNCCSPIAAPPKTIVLRLGILRALLDYLLVVERVVPDSGEMNGFMVRELHRDVERAAHRFNVLARGERGFNSALLGGHLRGIAWCRPAPVPKKTP